MNFDYKNIFFSKEIINLRYAWLGSSWLKSVLSSVDSQKIFLRSSLYPQITMVDTHLSLCLLFVRRNPHNRVFKTSSSSWGCCRMNESHNRGSLAIIIMAEPLIKVTETPWDNRLCRIINYAAKRTFGFFFPISSNCGHMWKYIVTFVINFCHCFLRSFCIHLTYS